MHVDGLGGWASMVLPVGGEAEQSLSITREDSLEATVAVVKLYLGFCSPESITLAPNHSIARHLVVQLMLPCKQLTLS